MGRYGGPQGRPIGLEITRQVPEPCSRREEEHIRPGLAGQQSTSRWESRRGAGEGRDRGGRAAAERSAKGLGSTAGGSRLRNRWRRGRALAGTAFVSAMTLSQGENERESSVGV